MLWQQHRSCFRRCIHPLEALGRDRPLWCAIMHTESRKLAGWKRRLRSCSGCNRRSHRRSGSASAVQDPPEACVGCNLNPRPPGQDHCCDAAVKVRNSGGSSTSWAERLSPHWCCGRRLLRPPEGSAAYVPSPSSCPQAPHDTSHNGGQQSVSASATRRCCAGLAPVLQHNSGTMQRSK